MSEENAVVEEQAVAETPTQENNEVGNLIAESKKYRQRSQAAEAELSELKDNLKLQEQQQLEEKEEFKSLYEKMKEENSQLKPVVEQFQIQEKQRREHLLSQLSDDDQEIYQDLPTMKLEKHIERLGNKKVQVSDAKEVTSSGKFATNTTFADMSDEDRQKARRNPKLWKQIVEGYSN
jgi:putative IMPACT (imprinted ancient) family translation regulator